MRPILFHLPFGLPLYGYGTMLLLSMIVGASLAMHLARRDGIDPEWMVRSIAWTLLCAMIGARLLFIVTNLGRFDRLVDVFRVWQGGVVAYGGFLGGFAGAVAFCRRRGARFLAWADCAAPAVAAGLAITRVGCLLAGCDFGKPWDGPWALRFPAGSPAFKQQQLQGLLPLGATESLPVHPTQIYESLVGLALLALAWQVRRRRAFPGQVFLSVVMGYGAWRCTVEVLRADAGRGGLGPLSTSQVIGLSTLLVAAAFLYVLSRRQQREPASLHPGASGRAGVAQDIPAPVTSTRRSSKASRRQQRPCVKT
jgi:phosphatidylglycerol:prolipoprotein diacylglycerol transferase